MPRPIVDDIETVEIPPPPRPDGRPHLSECLQVAHPALAHFRPEDYFCTCDEVYPDWEIG